MIALRVSGVAKEFNRRSIFRDISFELNGPSSLAITGRNGAGKSTLVKILAGVLAATRGNVEYVLDGATKAPDDARDLVGLVSPYLQLYDEFSAWENLRVLSRIRSNSQSVECEAEVLLRDFNLWHRRDDLVRTYSSGMKQRLKYAFALVHRPHVLFLDEPTSNLDAEGVDVVRAVAEKQRKRGILVVATNAESEASWCSERIHLG
jgi:heme exporter protein A